MKRPSPDTPIKPEIKWTGKHYVPLSDEERELRATLRTEIKAEGILDAHAEFRRRLPPRGIE